MTDSAISVVAAGLPGRYATALFDLALESKSLDETVRALDTLRDALAASSELRHLTVAPDIGRDAATSAITAVAAKLGLPQLVRNFLGVVARNGRLAEISAIIRQFASLVSAHRGTTVAEVTSATALSADQIAALEAKLKSRTGRDIIANVTVNPDLLGGLVVRIGSEQIDSSVRTRLERLGQQMKGQA